MGGSQPRLGLNLKVAQKQILTPGLVQMVSVLALNKLELRDMITQEIDHHSARAGRSVKFPADPPSFLAAGAIAEFREALIQPHAFEVEADLRRNRSGGAIF